MQRMIGMEIDVTQEHQTKDELTRLYSLLSDETATIRRDRERIFEMTADLMAVGKADGTLLSVNPAWSKVLGFSESELRRSEEHTSELQSLMRISYAVFCLKKQKQTIS